MAYDIFISYRRKGAGAGVAGELQAKLENRGYKVFLDVDNIGSGDFPVQIDQAIKECSDFLLILSPGMLDRCVDEEDWVRHEITLAEKYQKNIIGVSLPGFLMPEPKALPEPLRNIPEKQVFLWSHEYRNASIDKVASNLVSSKRKKRRNSRNLIWIAGVVVLAAVGVASFIKGNTPPDPEEVRRQAVMLATEAYNDTFSMFVAKGDSLLKLAPEPDEIGEYVVFMDALEEYGRALDVMRAHPEMVKDSVGLSTRYDSLMHLRAEWMNRELDVASKFVSVEQFDFAKFRYDNAKALALEEDLPQIEVVGNMIQN